MKLHVIITGATGMVGEGVLNECLSHADVEKVLVINRKPCNVSHPSLKEIIHQDFFDLTPIQDQLTGYNACFFCLGVSSMGLKEEEYHRLTHDLTINFAQNVLQKNETMTFIYVSGAGTDSTEKGRMMWANVKGKTENQLMNMGFNAAYMFRPGYMQPTKGLKNTLPFYRYATWMFPLLSRLFPSYVSTLKEVGIAMIHACINGYEKKILEVKDIVKLAQKA